MKTNVQQQTCETATGGIRIFAESVLKAYEVYGFTPTTRDGDAEKKVVNPMATAAYDHMVNNHPEDQRMTLAEVMIAVAENSVESMEYFFGSAMAPEYHNGFHVGVHGDRSDNPYKGEWASLYAAGYEDGLAIRKALLDARKVIVCPVCGPDGEWVYVNLPNRTRVDGSHAWCCDTCAIVAYEYNNRKDTIALDQYLNPSTTECIPTQQVQAAGTDGMTDYQMQQYVESKGHKLYDPVVDNQVDSQLLARLAVQYGFEWSADRELWFRKSEYRAPLGFSNYRPKNGDLRVWYMDNGAKVAYLVPLITAGAKRIGELMQKFGLTPKEAQGRMGLEVFLAADHVFLAPKEYETYWQEWGGELANIHQHMTAPELTHMGYNRFTYLTNRIGEETGIETLYDQVPNDRGGTTWVPTSQFADEAAWWERFSDLETFYVIHKVSGKRGAAYCEEFVYEDIDDEHDAAEAKEHELGNSATVFAGLQIKAEKIREQYPEVEVTLGYQTGPNGRHELYAFAPYGTQGNAIFKAIDGIVFS